MDSKKDTEFKFKQFIIGHDKSTMKVGTDAVLLGAWADISEAKRILEVGTGCGIIALMLAQRTSSDSHIDAIEIDVNSIEQAKENVARSPWQKKIKIHRSAFQEWKSDFKYDLIICNPPFFSKSLLPPDLVRTKARHSVSLTAKDLILGASELLSPHGKLSVVLPLAEGNAFIDLASKHHFCIHKQLAIFSRQGKPQERWLLEFALSEGQPCQSILTLHSAGNARSEEYKNLTSDFYLDN